MNTQTAIEALDRLIASVGESHALQQARDALVRAGEAEDRLAALAEQVSAADRHLSAARAEEQEIQRRVAAQAAAETEAEREHNEKLAWQGAESRLVEQRLAQAKAGLEAIQGHVYVSDPKSAKREWTLESYVASEAGKLDAEMAARDPGRDPQSRGDEAREKTRQKWFSIAATCIEIVAEWQEAKAITKQRTADAIASNAAAVAATTAGRR